MKIGTLEVKVKSLDTLMYQDLKMEVTLWNTSQTLPIILTYQSHLMVYQVKNFVYLDQFLNLENGNNVNA
jgi:hypothetical protein